jgi:hypothetical protein
MFTSSIEQLEWSCVEHAVRSSNKQPLMHTTCSYLAVMDALTTMYACMQRHYLV